MRKFHPSRNRRLSGLRCANTARRQRAECARQNYNLYLRRRLHADGVREHCAHFSVKIIEQIFSSGDRHHHDCEMKRTTPDRCRARRHLDQPRLGKLVEHERRQKALTAAQAARPGQRVDDERMARAIRPGLERFDAFGIDRTSHSRIFNPPLYQLSFPEPAARGFHNPLSIGLSRHHSSCSRRRTCHRGHRAG